MSGQAMGKYVLPGLETAGGAATEFIAPGNPIGLGLMGSGAGQLAGGTQGSQGQAIGGGLGGLLGMGGGMMGGNSELASLFGKGATPSPATPTLTGGNSANTSGLNNPQLAQMLPQLMKMFSGGGQQQQEQTPPPLPKAPSQPTPMTSMGPQSSSMPQSPQGPKAQDQTGQMLMAYLKSQGMLG